MKVLYLSSIDPHTKSGGGMAVRRNFNCISDIVGIENVTFHKIELMPKKTTFDKIKRNLSKLIKKTEYKEEQLVYFLASDYDLVFIENSKLGHIAYHLKRSGYKGRIYTYFHNCEYLLMKTFFNEKGLTARITLSCVKDNEFYAMKYSDRCIFINNRDKQVIQEFYNYVPSYSVVIPVTLKDSFVEINTNENISSTPIYTFLGSYFGPNISGVKWFADNVLPKVNIHFQIIGRGMNKIKQSLGNNPNIKILSDVENLRPYIEDSDYMIYPIFDGSGMKVKTCEALMYGKNIIGTPEAFCGYDIDDFSKVGACCSSAEEFIHAIHNLKMPRFNKYSRKLFLEKYSFESSLIAFRKLLNSDFKE